MYGFLKDLGVSIILRDGEIEDTTRINLNQTMDIDLGSELFKNNIKNLNTETEDKIENHYDDISSCVTHMEFSKQGNSKKDIYSLSNRLSLEVECAIGEELKIKTEVNKNKIKTAKYWKIADDGSFELDYTVSTNKETGRIVNYKSYNNGVPEKVITVSARENNEINTMSLAVYDTESKENYLESKLNITFKYSYGPNGLKRIRKYVNGEHVGTIRFFYYRDRLVNIKYFTEEMTYPEKTIEFTYFCDSILEVIYLYDEVKDEFITYSYRDLPNDKNINLVINN